jgi:hypothetical protein
MKTGARVVLEMLVTFDWVKFIVVSFKSHFLVCLKPFLQVFDVIHFHNLH